MVDFDQRRDILITYERYKSDYGSTPEPYPPIWPDVGPCALLPILEIKHLED